MNIKQILFSIALIGTTITYANKKIKNALNYNLVQAQRILYAYHSNLFIESQNPHNNTKLHDIPLRDQYLQNINAAKQATIQEYIQQGYSQQEATQYVESTLKKLSEDIAVGYWHEASYNVQRFDYRQALNDHFVSFCNECKFAGDETECKKLHQRTLNRIDTLNDIYNVKLKEKYSIK